MARYKRPAAVYDEAVAEGIERGFADAHTLRSFMQQRQWLPVSIVAIPPDLQASALDRGEQEAIALALACNGLLLMDEERGRQEARQRGLIVRGTLGVLIEAYRRDLITADQLRLCFQQIQERDDIWISPSLCRRLLRETFGDETSVRPERTQ